MPKPLIIANWKTNPDSLGRAVLLARKIEREIAGVRNVDVVVAPPFPFLYGVSRVLRKSKLGAQNVFWGDVGPYTGEVSWHQLKNLDVQYVIVGHSERRIHLGETDDMINKKVRSVLEHGLGAVLCIGERERIVPRSQNAAGIPAIRDGLGRSEIPPIVGEELRSALKGVRGSRLKNLTIAYEPLWAISTTPGARADTPDNAFRAKVYIKRTMVKLYGSRVAAGVRIIYGGSVGEKNIAGFLHDGEMEGALVGGASLRPDEFISIVKQATKIK